MNLDEFVKTASRRGLASKETARKYGESRTEFTESDLEEVYRYQESDRIGRAGDRFRSYQGARCTKRLKEPEV